MNNFKNALAFIGIGIGIGVCLAVAINILLGARPSTVTLGPVEFDLPTETLPDQPLLQSTDTARMPAEAAPMQITDTPDLVLSPTEVFNPAPSPIPDTPPGTVLEPGQWWYAGLKGLLLNREVNLRAPSEIITTWEIINLTPNPVVINSSEDNFWVTDNLGRSGTVKTWNGSLGALTIASGEKCNLGTSCIWTTQVVFGVNIADPAVTEVIITVSFSNFQNAQWRIPIYH
jgi:hypothetical protein